MSEVRDTPINSNRGGTNSPIQRQIDTIRLMKTCSTRSKRLDQYLSDYRASKDKQSVLNNRSVRTLFIFLDWRGRTNSWEVLIFGHLEY